ncbi:hypothetical protein [Tardiphaga sp.]|uniref:hypothetical protein n=1 Tax=Tardiphaga sp. TaxID=1926292 RepID=UPI0026113C50|nr:hypothetical protein [Tardiphaga sp.]MDB5619276.1 hypothetical protein [Tardiphaga sp.]
MASFLDLQNGFYNALSQGLGFPPGSPFQLIQPSPPLVAGPKQDAAVWNYFNLIPPATLTNDFVQSGGNQFFSDYSGLLSTLKGAPNTFETDVGPACLAAWNAYAMTLPLTVSLSMMPAVFQRWAALNGYMSVANTGANDLAAMVLDPITAAKLAIMPYSGTSPTNQPNWDAGYNDLANMLAVAPSRSFQFDSSTANSNVSNTWCNGSQSAYFGLWSNSSSSSSQSQAFASSGVTVSTSFQHVTPFTAVPGPWYSSAAMGEAFSNRSGAPWVSGPTNWGNTFDPTSGKMARFASSIVVASGMFIKVESQASFSQADQAAIQQSSSGGMWPFYSQSNNSGTTTSTSFDNQGHMTAVITSQPGVPIVLGVNVEPVANYVGTAVVGAQLRAQALSTKAA